jgi:hypothetical protein
MPTVQNVQMFKSFKPFASEEMRHRVNVHEYASLIALGAARLKLF